DRLIRKLDELIEQGSITETVFAQIGQSSYIPKFYDYERFMDVQKFEEYQKKADLIISHGGTGALIGALKLGKQVIAVPRLSKFGEHSDDHQTQVAGVLADEGYLRCVLNMEDLAETIHLSLTYPIKKRYDKSSSILDIINDFINDFNFLN
ncbi:MAG: hypothetical protein GX963_05010, partial [Bacteroidales bacterium]|nr:hypothetical protein [Bacteroidales bacterium]